VVQLGTACFDGQPFTVIGIVPASFQILFKSDLWTPFVTCRSPEQRRMHYLQVFARFKPGVSLARADAGMQLVAANIARISPETNKDWGITIEPLRQALVGRVLRVTSLVLAGVVGFVLLMACANVANLLFVKAAGRTREIAVRASLGGSRGRILWQLLTGSVLLAGLGGAAGVALAWDILRVTPTFLPPGMLPVMLHLGVEARVAGFVAALTLATGLLFGLAPAWQVSRNPLADSLRAGGRTATGGAGAMRTIRAVGQIAIAVLLAAGAGLLLRTLASLNDVDPGYRAENVLTMSLSLPRSRYPTPADALTFYQSIEREIAALPGIRDVALGGNLPLDGWDIGQGFEIVGQPSPGEANQASAHYQIVSARYFDTLGIPLVRGRAFTPRDTASTSPVCIVNEEFVRRHLKGTEPIGTLVRVQAMDAAGPKPVVREIVGVIHQVKVEGLGEKENSVEIYVPITQNPWYWAILAVRTTGEPTRLVLAPMPTARVTTATMVKSGLRRSVRTTRRSLVEKERIRHLPPVSLRGIRLQPELRLRQSRPATDPVSVYVGLRLKVRRGQPRCRARPVCDSRLAATTSGGPAATTRPPPAPPSGPRSMTQSELAITSRLCSMTTSVWPASIRWSKTRSIRATSSACRPLVGSSNR
jgi:putative ABC transport system permease protein